MRRASLSPWTFVALGCTTLAAALVAFGAFLFVGQRMARAIGTQVSDPLLQRARTQEILPAPRLPAGWEGKLGVSVPLLGRVAVYERPGAAGGDDGLFLYLERPDAEGPPADPAADIERLLEVRGLELRRGELLANGTLSVGRAWLAHRAARAVLVLRPPAERAVLVAWLEVHCPDPRPSRLAVWLEADPFPGQEILDLAGTPADPAAVRAFASAFDFCH